MSSTLAQGDKAPDFSARAVGGIYGEGRMVGLKDFAGQTLVLYFYPKDDTPGCTTQACALRDGWGKISTKATVFGVSVDGVESHAKFIEKYALPFPLLSDPDKSLAKSYGLWVEKNRYGRTYMGTERTTVVIAPDGRIQAILPKVKPAGHFEQLLAILEA